MDAQPPSQPPKPPPLEPQPPQLTPPSPAPTQRRRAVSRKQLISALAVIVAIVAGATTAVVLVNHHSTAPAPVATRANKPSTPQSQPALTVPEVILQRNTNSAGSVDFEGALQLFSYVFTPLPGVTVPTGAPGEPADYADLAI